MLFSIIYPTRDRPKFIEKALYFLSKQKFKEFEVIVCDNYSSEEFSCEKICQDSLLDIKYIRPEKDLNMVENWNYAYGFAQGEYIAYFTDKMFLLPDTLQNVYDIIKDNIIDIVTWRDNFYHPNQFPYYFKKGAYKLDLSKSTEENDFWYYDPKEILEVKAQGNISRDEQSKSLYASGKICFGMYHRDLCHKIIIKHEKLFRRISPDYTSMIYALSYAKKAIELKKPGIVHIMSDLSNGGLNSIDDKRALTMAQQSDEFKYEYNNYLIPALYSSASNKVVYDYLHLKREADLSFTINKVNWFVYIYEDLCNPKRVWSSLSVKEEQFNLFYSHFKELSIFEKFNFMRKLTVQKVKKRIKTLFVLSRTYISRFKIIRKIRTFLNRNWRYECKNIEDILTIEQKV